MTEIGVIDLKKYLGPGHRLTGQRKVIANIILSASDHPDAAEVHRRATALDARISLATVYRTLRLFAETGVIEVHAFDGKRTRFEGSPEAHHDHLIDIDTGQITEFNSREIECLQKAIADGLGFELTGHRLELYGRRRR